MSFYPLQAAVPRYRVPVRVDVFRCQHLLIVIPSLFVMFMAAMVKVMVFLPAVTMVLYVYCGRQFLLMSSYVSECRIFHLMVE
jgi:hypothetical protein